MRNRPLRKKWQCYLCKKYFACRSAYYNHERTHTGEKPFRCNVCGRCFGHQGNLKQHMHIHCEDKPHVCDICGRGFTRSNRLRDHKRSHQYQHHVNGIQQRSTENRGYLLNNVSSVSSLSDGTNLENNDKSTDSLINMKETKEWRLTSFVS